MAQRIRQQIAQQIVDTVKDVCGQDINFIDPDGKIYASTNPNRIGDFHEVGKRAATERQIIEVDNSGKYSGTQIGVNMPYQYNGEIVAVIGITGEPEEVRKYGYLAQRITGLILREQELNAKHNSRREAVNFIVQSLISGQEIDRAFLKDFMKTYEISEEKDYRTILAELNSGTDPVNFSSVETEIYQIFRSTGSKLYSFHYPNQYILIIGADEMKKYEKIFRQEAESQKKILRIVAGERQSFYRQDRSFQSAELILKGMAEGDSYGDFEQLNLELLLGAIPESARNIYLHKILEHISPEDRKLLNTYFACGTSLKATAEKLFLHKNTVQYQLDRVKIKCGYDPRNFQEGIILYLALLLSEIRN